ncbi:hypothetical protein TTHERM_001214999 (macronuclear) [Tetrahymena thermophila SB210]|uniref:Uncharacterized protein n=1 Tax=Tetrahymena thermophila (strain SB210) TaxID=312017 RepID=W7XBC5_TETTS|nr:hypothetical protein TTHERM_001214999 [Tetrahymena thermophila SB210]EWS73728.1 hypothetical protein TTHERM_001214999 [Tetrahymena thermophila SB210]|eukprot:XP_012653766.1 hypothetical protein TTHERM_001214999 [Tetrahymena thermophila SB210]
MVNVSLKMIKIALTNKILKIKQIQIIKKIITMIKFFYQTILLLEQNQIKIIQKKTQQKSIFLLIDCKNSKIKAQRFKIIKKKIYLQNNLQTNLMRMILKMINVSLIVK